MAFGVFSRNGEILDAAEATVPLSKIEYTYGFGVYESIRVVRGRALFLADHLRRLLHSATIIGLEHGFTEADMTAWTEALVSALETDAFNLKMQLVGGRTAQDATLYIIPLAPLFPDKRLYTKGATALTVPLERFLPHAKSLNMLPSYLAYRKAKTAGCYDALCVNREGCITEGTRTNFFAMRGTTLISPPVEEILEGVTLMHVLEVAGKHGYTVAYEPIPLLSLAEYDGAFLTSTSSKIMPLSLVDQQVLQIPEALKTLMKHFDLFLDELL